MKEVSPLRIKKNGELEKSIDYFKSSVYIGLSIKEITIGECTQDDIDKIIEILPRIPINEIEFWDCKNPDISKFSQFSPVSMEIGKFDGNLEILHNLPSSVRVLQIPRHKFDDIEEFFKTIERLKNLLMVMIRMTKLSDEQKTLAEKFGWEYNEGGILRHRLIKKNMSDAEKKEYESVVHLIKS